MTQQTGYLDGKAIWHLIRDDGQQEEFWLEREFWFDRDIDGRWLVGAAMPRGRGDGVTGAIVVRDPKLGAFIELLVKLITHPERFADERVVLGPAWDGQLPAG